MALGITHSIFLQSKSRIWLASGLKKKRGKEKILIISEIINNNNNGNFICVFDCAIVNLATYNNNNKSKISVALFPGVNKSALQKFHRILNTILNEEKVKIKFKVIRLIERSWLIS